MLIGMHPTSTNSPKFAILSIVAILAFLSFSPFVSADTRMTNVGVMTDNITEYTSGNGILIEHLTIKDDDITGIDDVNATQFFQNGNAVCDVSGCTMIGDIVFKESTPSLTFRQTDDSGNQLIAFQNSTGNTLVYLKYDQTNNRIEIANKDISDIFAMNALTGNITIFTGFNTGSTINFFDGIDMKGTALKNVGSINLVDLTDMLIGAKTTFTKNSDPIIVIDRSNREGAMWITHPNNNKIEFQLRNETETGILSELEFTNGLITVSTGSLAITSGSITGATWANSTNVASTNVYATNVICSGSCISDAEVDNTITVSNYVPISGGVRAGTAAKVDHGRVQKTDSPTQTFSFGFTFSAAPTVIITEEYDAVGKPWYLDNVTTTQFTVAGSSPSTGYFHYIAIGVPA